MMARLPSQGYEQEDSSTEGSVLTHILCISGLLGIAAAFGLETYRVVMFNQTLGTEAAPEWIASVRFTLLAMSLVVVVYATAFEHLFGGELDIVIGGALVGQWGMPISLYLDAQATDSVSLFAFGALACAAVFTAVALAVAVSYAQNYLLRPSTETGETETA